MAAMRIIPVATTLTPFDEAEKRNKAKLKSAKYILSTVGLLIVAFVIYLSIDGFPIFRDPMTVVTEQQQAVKDEDIDAKLSVKSLQEDMDFLLKVLINHNVYSAAVGFVGAIKDHHIATLIGEETGENTNG